VSPGRRPGSEKWKARSPSSHDEGKVDDRAVPFRAHWPLSLSVWFHSAPFGTFARKDRLMLQTTDPPQTPSFEVLFVRGVVALHHRSMGVTSDPM
jgi:hypothetical protein